MITLYLATHNKTGLKYFGKSTKYHTVEELQKYYHGSGKYWRNHLKKHGDDVTMQIYYSSNNEKLIEQLALQYSKKWKIVESNEYANLKEENGYDGNPKGHKHSNMTKSKIGEKSKGRKSPKKGLSLFEYYSDEQVAREQINKMKSSDYHKAKTYEERFGVEKAKVVKNKKSKSVSGKNNPMYGKKNSWGKHTDEELCKMRLAAKNRKKLKCPHCNVFMDICNVKRWHFDNCKFKDDMFWEEW